jgi:hypothetical protein
MPNQWTSPVLIKWFSVMNCCRPIILAWVAVIPDCADDFNWGSVMAFTPAFATARAVVSIWRSVFKDKFSPGVIFLKLNPPHIDFFQFLLCMDPMKKF